jgi:hypothetical protein
MDICRALKAQLFAHHFLIGIGVLTTTTGNLGRSGSELRFVHIGPASSLPFSIVVVNTSGIDITHRSGLS